MHDELKNEIVDLVGDPNSALYSLVTFGEAYAHFNAPIAYRVALEIDNGDYDLSIPNDHTLTWEYIGT